MNKIKRPTFKESKAVRELTSNGRLKNHTDLTGRENDILIAYKEYIKTCGCPNLINYTKLGEALETALKYYYEHPPKSHKEIDLMRSKSVNSLCPMCGSMHRGSLDHILPKTIYPEFSLFTRNLVPACKCNQSKGTTSSSNGTRILHPYYDEILKDRLLIAKIKNYSASPLIDVVTNIPQHHPSHANVNYHLDEVVKKNDIVGYLNEQWESFYLFPESIIRNLTPQITSPLTIAKMLKNEIELLDFKHKGKNNWNSIFITGLYNKQAIQWIITELQSPLRDVRGRIA